MTAVAPARRASPHPADPDGRAIAVRIAGIGTATPPRRVSRGEVAAALPRIWPELARRTTQLVDPLGEDFRYLLREPSEMVEAALSPSEQTARYANAAPALAAAAAEKAIASSGIDRTSIGLLVVTSCTGFMLPGLDAHLLPMLGLRADTWRLPIAQLGCAGGAGGLARAAEWTRGHPGERALVVAVEVPSLTFRPSDHSTDNLLSALVFGDGAGAAVLEAGGGAANEELAVGRVRSILVPGSVGALGYDLADDGFRVILSRRLPALLAAALPPVVEDFSGPGVAATLDAVALHPGGSSIVDAVGSCLGLRDTQLMATRTVLREWGNTSSAAIFFVLDELRRSPPRAAGRGLVIGIGPGLTVELLDITWGC